MYGNREKINIWEYLIVLMLVFVSGNPLFCNLPIFPFFEIFFLVFIFLVGKMHFPRHMWLYLVGYFVVYLSQYFILGEIAYMGSMNRILKILFGVAVVSLLGEKFRYAYFDVFFIIALISLVGYGMQVMHIPFPFKFINFRSPRFFTAVFYNYVVEDSPFLRNCGSFWEPGAYACYLVLIPLLFIDRWKEMLTLHPFKCLTMGVALLTTFSTTGYLAFLVCVLFGLIGQSNRKFLLLVTVIPLLTFAAYKMYDAVDFLGDKVERQNDEVEEFANRPDFSNTRVGSLVFDLHYIQKHPLIGNGLSERTRFADNPEMWGEEIGHGNGFSNYMAQMGIPLFVIFFLLIYRSFPFSRFQRITIMIILILLLQGEQLLNYPLLLSFPFIVINERAVEERRKRQELLKSRRYLYRSIREG